MCVFFSSYFILPLLYLYQLNCKHNLNYCFVLPSFFMRTTEYEMKLIQRKLLQENRLNVNRVKKFITKQLNSCKLHTHTQLNRLDETMRMKTMVVGLIKVRKVQTISQNEPIKCHDKSIANGCQTYISHATQSTY